MYIYAKSNNLIGKNCAGSKLGGVQCLMGGYNYENIIYWSASSSSINLAWLPEFIDGFQLDVDKVKGHFGVSTIRCF